MKVDCTGRSDVRWRPLLLALPVAAGCALTPASPPAATDSAAARVRDDARVQQAVEDARAQFLAGQHFDRLDVTVLLAASGGLWLRGSVGGDRPWYPASCVKLGFAIDLNDRLVQHRTAAPTARVLKSWPCKRSWEVTVMDCLSSVTCRHILNEVFECDNLDDLIGRGDELFRLLPDPKKRAELSEHSPHRI